MSTIYMNISANRESYVLRYEVVPLNLGYKKENKEKKVYLKAKKKCKAQKVK